MLKARYDNFIGKKYNLDVVHEIRDAADYDNKSVHLIDYPHVSSEPHDNTRLNVIVDENFIIKDFHVG